MKNFQLQILVAATISLSTANQAWSQANTELSNLVSPTKVNVNLLPSGDNSKSLGSAAKSWKDFYMDGYLYLDGYRWLGNPGSDNTMIGKSAGTITTGADNTFIGKETGVSNTSGFSNTFIGEDAGWKNTTGTENIFIGTDAGYYNVSGSQNVAIGVGALLNNPNSGQTAVGYHALYSSVGFYVPYIYLADNSAYGAYSLAATTTGYDNSAFGASSLSGNTEGYSNSAFGVSSLISNTTGSQNSAFGHYALFQNGTGIRNSAFGFQALFHISMGSYNTAFGAMAGYNLSGLVENSVFIGYESGYGGLGALGYGSDNCFVGTQSGYTIKAGEHNSFFGSHAGYGNTDGSYGTFIGFDAGGNNTTGSQNTYLGYSTEGSSGTYSNVIGIGYQLTNTASNQARIGNSSTTSIGGWASWSNVSDGRFKKNVKEEVVGLDFINKLRPVTYTLDLHGADAFIGKEFTADNETEESAKISEQAKSEKEKIIYSGFIAQEVEKAATEVNYNFSGVDAPKNEKDLYGLRYAEFVVPLVKAVQELSAENEELKKQIDKLSGVVFGSKMNDGAIKIHSEIYDSQFEIILGQNIPNPFDNTTLIPFRIPKDCHSASIVISELNGRAVTAIPITCNETHVVIEAGNLAAGNYEYALYVDGNQIDSKQMLIVK